MDDLLDELHHECGIAALYDLANGEYSEVWSGSPNKVARLMPRMLLDLQNRGQLAAGMSGYNPDRDKLIDTFKQLGPVNEAFRIAHPKKRDRILDECGGQAVIGHVRYSTTGQDTRDYAQPFERKHSQKWKWFAFAFNGQLANYEQLRDELLERHPDYHIVRKDNDTEVILHYLAREMQLSERSDFVRIFQNLSQLFDGSYNIVFLNAHGDMVVSRDPLGLRPLCYAFDGRLFAAASESVALLNLGFESSQIHSLAPGHLILIQDGQFAIHRYAETPRTAHCFFEWIYFANVASTFDGRSVYLSRSALGRELAKQEVTLAPFQFDRSDTIIVPVPDTGKAAADAMAYELGIPSREGLIRNRYVGRTFIEGGNRADKVRTKFTPLREVLEGKKVILVEDSIVRSTTMNTLLNYIRDVGRAKEIHVRVACPPIIAPCFYGIDMSTMHELYAPKRMAGDVPTFAEQQRMAKELGADTLLYLPVEAVANCLEIPAHKLCRACLTKEYPTETGRKLFELSLVSNSARIYEPAPALATQ